MKLLYIAHCNNHGGGSTVALKQIVSYMKQLHEVRILCPKPTNEGGELTDWLESNGISYYSPCRYEMFVYSKRRNPYYFLRENVTRIVNIIKIRKKIGAILDDYKPDVVHTNSGVVDIALDACIKRGIPHIWHLREYQDLDFKFSIIPCKSLWLRQIHKEGNYNIAITKGIFDYFKLRSCDTQLYDGPIDDLKTSPLLEIKQEKYFLFVANQVFNSAKGLFDALEAFSIFCSHKEGYRLKIVGSCSFPLTKVQQKHINRLGIAEHIDFLGPRRDVYQLMASATSILVPSYFEGFGLITAEAMFNGCLVIGRDTGGTKEQFDNGFQLLGNEIGLRFNTVSEMAECMICATKYSYVDMRQRAKSVVKNLYTSMMTNQALAKFYLKVLEENKKSKGIRE